MAGFKQFSWPVLTYDAPILRSPSVSRIQYVSDTDMAGIRRGYVSSNFYYFQILLCIGYAYGYVWATLDTAQHIFWPIQPTNRYNPNSLRPPTLPVSHEQQPPGVRGALLPHPPGATCDAARRRGRRRPRATPPTRRPPVLLPHGLSSASAAPARPLLRRPCSPTAPRPLLRICS